MGQSRLSMRGRSWSSLSKAGWCSRSPGARHEVEAGDAPHFMGDQPHHWANEESKPARALWVALRDS